MRRHFRSFKSSQHPARCSFLRQFRAKERLGRPPDTAIAVRTCALAFLFLLSIFGLLNLTNCGAPGEPTARRAPVPEAVTDLSAQQTGDNLILSFSLPKQTAWGAPLAASPAVEIYRDFSPIPPAGAPPAAPPQTLLATIPGQMVDKYVQDGRMTFVSDVKPPELEAHAGQEAIFAVRTQASARKASDVSNVVTLQIYPPPAPILGLVAMVSRSAIILNWLAPRKTTAGNNLPPVDHYEVYRAEEPTSATEPTAPNSAPDLKNPLEMIGEPTMPEFEDTQFQFGHTYVYSVRSVVRDGTDLVESADSNLVAVTPRNTFPPPAPQGLVVVFVPATGNAPAHMDLTWDITNETNVAGYNVYRREGNLSAQRVNTSLVLAPAFRDFSIRPGESYTYTVTAVDSADNESPPSASVSGSIP